MLTSSRGLAFRRAIMNDTVILYARFHSWEALGSQSKALQWWLLPCPLLWAVMRPSHWICPRSVMPHASHLPSSRFKLGILWCQSIYPQMLSTSMPLLIWLLCNPRSFSLAECRLGILERVGGPCWKHEGSSCFAPRTESGSSKASGSIFRSFQWDWGISLIITLLLFLFLVVLVEN